MNQRGQFSRMNVNETFRKQQFSNKLIKAFGTFFIAHFRPQIKLKIVNNNLLHFPETSLNAFEFIPNSKKRAIFLMARLVKDKIFFYVREIRRDSFI